MLPIGSLSFLFKVAPMRIENSFKGHKIEKPSKLKLYNANMSICSNLHNLIPQITTAADNKFCNIFLNFRKKVMIFHENRLPADDSHKISYLICYFRNGGKL